MFCSICNQTHYASGDHDILDSALCAELMAWDAASDEALKDHDE